MQRKKYALTLVISAMAELIASNDPIIVATCSAGVAAFGSSMVIALPDCSRMRPITDSLGPTTESMLALGIAAVHRICNLWWDNSDRRRSLQHKLVTPA